MATIRQRRPGVWEVRGYTGKDVAGKSTQVSRTVYGSKKDAQLVAAELTVKPARNAGGRKLRQLLDEWIDIKTPGWADLTIRDQTSRARQVAADPIGNMSVASIGVSDVDRWVARLRKAGVGEGAIRNQHTVLRSALQQAVRWEWIATNPASSAPIESPKRQQQRTLTSEEVRSVIAAAADVHELAPLAFRLGAEMGARRSELAALRWVRGPSAPKLRRTRGARRSGGDEMVLIGEPLLRQFDERELPDGCIGPTDLMGWRRVLDALRASPWRLENDPGPEVDLEALFNPESERPTIKVFAGRSLYGSTSFCWNPHRSTSTLKQQRSSSRTPLTH